MIRYIRDIQARRKGVELEPGFTLIELLIVIVVLGILAATVIFALGGMTRQSAVAACQSDGKSYEVAVAAFENAPANTLNAPPAKHHRPAGWWPYGRMLHTAANNSHYSSPSRVTRSRRYDRRQQLGRRHDHRGHRWHRVGWQAGGPLANYDTQGAGGCNGVS